MRFIVVLLVSLMYCYDASAQPDSCRLRISLLTCGPGPDLYTAWGHTAVRVTDSVRHTDIIYNYGTFDFMDPDFYAKFVKGKMLYFVSIDDYRDFILEYRLDGRGIVEQVLNLSCQEKDRLSNALQVNAQEENKYYFYQFLFDNCSTRVRDIIKANTEQQLVFDNIIPQPVPTFRKLIHVDLDNSSQAWGKLGIDLSLGSLIDRAPTNEEMMFLPEYLSQGITHATTGGHKLELSKQTLLPQTAKFDDSSLFTPMNTTIALLIIIIAMTFVRQSWSMSFLKIFDVVLFFITGGIGAFLIFLWFGTGHDLTARNYNLLWALPTHLPVSFFILRKKEWVRKYFLAAFIFYCLLILCWALLPQGMNPAFLPFVVLLGFRSFIRSRQKIADD